MTDTKKTTTTYHANEGVSVQAEVYKVTTPQAQGTVIAGRIHYLVRKGGARVEIKVGDFIIRGENGEVDAMPPALFNQLFTIDADEVKAMADETAALNAAMDAEVEEAVAKAKAEANAQAEADAEAEAAADAAEVVIDESPDSELNIFELPDDDDVPPEPEPKPESEPKPAKKKAKSRRKKKA